jgi:hypothetical protein
MADERRSTVWMVNALTGLDGRKGVLSLRNGSLVFDPESTRVGQSVFQVSDIKRVRRVRGSPVLDVALKGAAFQSVGFYFVEPPSLKADPDMMFFRTKRIRKKALNTLRVANAVKKPEIEEWIRWIEEARGP